MVEIRPFRSLSPKSEWASSVASPPYDVVRTEEARAMVESNPLSFLRVVRAEVNAPEGVDIYSDEVYQSGRAQLAKWVEEGIFERGLKPCFYLYEQVMGTHRQTGLVGLASCIEYDQEKVRIHEYTRPDKERDRVRHIEALGVQSGPVFLAYQQPKSLKERFAQIQSLSPWVDFVAEDGVGHRCWK
ncbi:MAG: DUF1015 domain-containing protein, partial [Myxococcota bacterium]